MTALRGRHLGAALLALLCAAPTAGDIGGCGEPPEEISSERYSLGRKRLECARCRECSVGTERCRRACDPEQPGDVALPETCRPLVRDAEVCFRALLDASCDAFARAVDDRDPRGPAECLFCRVGLRDPRERVPRDTPSRGPEAGP